MKFLMAGLGSIGRRHLRRLMQLDQQDILLYRSHQSTLPDEDLAHFPVETDLEKALDWGPDAVIISTPTALHLDTAIPAAERGCHLLLEKPISHNMERVEKLMAAAGANGCKVLVGYQFRYHPGLMQVKNWLDAESIGRVISFNSHWGEYLPDWHPWEDYRQGYAARKDLGGGVALTLSHPFDYLRWLFGEAKSVWANTSSEGLKLEVEDTVDAGINFLSGVVGTVHLDYLQRPSRHSLEVIGTKGTIIWENSTGLAHLSIEGGNWTASELPDGFSRDTLFDSQLNHFIDLLMNEADSRCSLEDGIKALQIAEAVKISAERKKMVSL